MTKKRNKNFLSLILSMMLIVAMAFHMTACGDNKTEQPNIEAEGDSDLSTEAENNQSVENDSTDTTQQEATVLGEGKQIFLFTVTDAEGNENLRTLATLTEARIPSPLRLTSRLPPRSSRRS